jgi:DNA repair/transcription protein MET18/MMS19
MLGEHLTNVDELVRARGTLLLAEVLTRLPTFPLDATAVHFLVGFFCDRIQDYPCVGEVLKGLIAIARNHSLADNDPELIVRTYVIIILSNVLFFPYFYY